MNPEKWARIHLRLRPRQVRSVRTFSNLMGTMVVGKISPLDWNLVINKMTTAAAPVVF